jgi:quinol monooxygenase YgiN
MSEADRSRHEALIIISRVSVRPGRREEFRALIPQLCRAAEDEPGTLVFSFQHERENPDDYWLVEMYRNAEAHVLHRRNSVDPVRAQLEDLFVTWPHRRYCVPIAAKGFGPPVT